MLSVVIATHNEEKNLTGCLDSIADLASEIIVVDGESTDETLDIAKRFKAKIIKTTNKKNFHINKQIGLDEAKGKLVLQLDADEHVDVELKKFIKKIINKIKNKEDLRVVAWTIKRKNYFMGHWLKKGGQYPDAVIRLFINGHAKLPQKDVHEQMIVEGKVGEAVGHLLHYSNPSFRDYLIKFNRYTSFKANQLKKQKLKINFFNSLNYLIFKPILTFFWLYFRHKGFVDGVPGFIFALFSGLHHGFAYLKLWELYEKD